MKKKNNNLKKQFKKIFYSDDKKPLLLVGFLLIIIVILVIGIFSFLKEDDVSGEVLNENLQEEQKSEKKSERQDCEYTRVVDGVCLENYENKKPRLVAVMFDNHPKARPQVGLAEASIVYEAPVEGNYTRFMGVYPITEDQDIPKIGPIRSARPYFVDWLGPFADPLYAHVGGSPEALDLIPERSIFDVSEFSKGWYFWRAQDRYAPHNAYSSMDMFKSVVEDYDLTSTSSYEGWNFTLGEICVEECVTSIDITFLYPSFVSSWEYVSSTNQYDRYMAGERHIDADGDEIIADTIVVQRVSSQVIDNVGRKRIKTTGTGEAYIFQNGKVIEGIWKRDRMEDLTRWYDKDDNEIKLNPGKIWIEVVATTMDVSYE